MDLIRPFDRLEHAESGALRAPHLQSRPDRPGLLVIGQILYRRKDRTSSTHAEVCKYVICEDYSLAAVVSPYYEGPEIVNHPRI